MNSEEIMDFDKLDTKAAMSFQKRVANWMRHTFDQKGCDDITERCDRFLEEALELMQSLGYDRRRVAMLTDYVYERPKGEQFQELGGTMVTLAALCTPANLDLEHAAETELTRCWANMEKIRAKQAMKRDKLGPLP